MFHTRTKDDSYFLLLLPPASPTAAACAAFLAVFLEELLPHVIVLKRKIRSVQQRPDYQTCYT